MEFGNLEPRLVWGFFQEITRVPRPSKKEEKIRAYLREFARRFELSLREDAKGNIVIERPASAGREQEPPLILQSHVDMVCEKEAGVQIDFENDPIDAYLDSDGWVKARGTTLGADCGIGMALAMAALVDPQAEGPKLEALFTVDEEQGLTGAMHLGEGMLTGRRMVNLDSEDEGEIFIGCAGGIDTLVEFAFQPEETPAGYTYYKVRVGGLHGGHSGDDIEKGFGNANKLLTRLLSRLEEQHPELRVGTLEGGNLRNAIPREAEAVLGFAAPLSGENKKQFDEWAAEIRAEYAITEPRLNIALLPTEAPSQLLPREMAHRLVAALYAIPNGVVAMSRSMPGLVETSTNLASVKMPERGKVLVTTSQRSSVESAKYDIAARVGALFSLVGGKVTHSDGYPGWAPNPDSPLVRDAVAIYRELFGAEPKVKAIHAGLECGLFLTRYPRLEMISIGPTLRDVHSPSERLEVASVEKMWHYLREIIKKQPM